MDLKGGFPQVYDDLVAHFQKKAVEKVGYLLANQSRRQGTGVEDTPAPERGSNRNPGNQRGSGRTRSEPGGIEVTIAPDRKAVPVSNDLPGQRLGVRKGQ